jgi:uncharacterized protein YcfL
MLMDYLTLSRNLFNVSLASLLLSFAAGCAEAAPTTSSTLKAPGAKVVMLDKDLKKDLAVEKVKGVRTANQMLVAEASLRNRGSNEVRVQVQTVYQDAKGNPISLQSMDAWTVMVVPVKSAIPYRSQSLSPLAQNFTIQLRYLK